MSVLTNQEVNIIRGGDVIFIINIKNAETDLPYVFEEGDEVSVFFVNEAKTLLEKDLEDGVEITSLAGGQLEVTLSDTETLALKKELKQMIEVEINRGSVKTIIQLKDILNVRDRLKA